MILECLLDPETIENTIKKGYWVIKSSTDILYEGIRICFIHNYNIIIYMMTVYTYLDCSSGFMTLKSILQSTILVNEY
jgi:hypothetical protein